MCFDDARVRVAFQRDVHTRVRTRYGVLNRIDKQQAEWFVRCKFCAYIELQPVSEQCEVQVGQRLVDSQVCFLQ